ncbi:ATP-dependent metallopeptidase FtsH/Yme1/Tma family protein [Candidatus Microgenomates bacterium]|nr:ATP-dependent metallopeptidase FtsH/Yme1/Tma family protein [Candidatus Microgenomates bacterium]
MDAKRRLTGRKPSRNLSLLILGVVIALIVFAANMPSGTAREVSLSEVVQKVKANEIAKVEIDGTKITATPKDAGQPKLVAFKEDSAVSLTEYGIDPTKVPVDVKNPSKGGGVWLDLVIGIFPIFLIMGFFYFMMRQAQGSSQQALGFGKSKARVFGAEGEKARTTFRDVAGAAEAKEELEEVVEFLRSPKKFLNLGARIPKGVLMVGAPGTGKTLLARAVAGEAGVPFFHISASEFVEMFVGVGASRVRDLFMKAKKNAPCIIFIDEIDAVGRRRGSGMGGGHDEREQTLNQILVEMDGFEPGDNVIVLSATNRPDVLDPALLRPGRFDRQVMIDLPDRKERLAIMKVHLRNKPIADDVKLESLAGKTAGMSGADLANVANEAAIVSARRNRKEITNKDLDDAFEKVAIGPERKSRVMSEAEKELTAHHEGGHALVGHLLPNADPVHKVTIVARGAAGGVTWSLPVEDRSYTSRAEFMDTLATMMAGRVAEEVVYGPARVTTGAGNDLRKATQVARDMVIKYGMSPKLPNLALDAEEQTFLVDRDFVHSKRYSEATAEVIDQEVSQLIQDATKRARQVIEQNRSYLDKLAKALLKQETLEESEIGVVLKGAKI